MTEETKVTNQEYWKGFMEAPASDTFKWIDGNGIEHMTTLRAWNGGNLYKTIAEFEQKVIETGGRSAMPQQAPKPALADAPEANATGLTLAISKLKVTPEVKDGVQRILVELFSEGHQWADIKAFYNTGDSAAAAFASVTSLNFHEAGEYSINLLADYRLSEKKNSKGNPYKNLVSVRPV